MATSFWRVVARARSRLATFAQAISRTKLTDRTTATASLSDRRPPSRAGCQQNSASRVVVRVPFFDVPGDCVHIRAGLFESHTGLEAGYRIEVMTISYQGHVVIGPQNMFRHHLPGRDPQIGYRVGKLELGRHHPDDGQRLTVGDQVLPENAGVGAEAALPQTLAYQRPDRCPCSPRPR